jgi:TolC family type I secretion outer membrane protein
MVKLSLFIIRFKESSHAMRHRSLIYPALILALPLLTSSGVHAESGDVFSTLELTSPSVAGSMLPGDDGQEPCSIVHADGPLGLADVVERALCNNPLTREAWANARFQAAQVGIGRSAYLPTVNANGSLSLNNVETSGTRGSSSNYNQQSASISLGYVLYDFGARDANLENALQVLAAANSTQDATLQSVFLAAVQGYYRLFGTQAAVEAAIETERSNQESLNAATARYNAGVGTPADKLLAQTAYSQAVLTRVRAEGELKNARGILANVMGLDANTQLELALPSLSTPPEHFEDDVARLIEDARKYRPDLAAAEAQIKAAQANVELATAAGKPTVSLSTSLGFADSSITNSARDAALGVQISIPIFTGYENTYRIRAAREQVEVQQAQREKLSLQIALDVWQAYQSLVTGTQTVRSSEDLLLSAIQSEKVSLGRYKAGVGNILDTLVAQSALANARQQRILALYNWQISKATLAQSMGQLDMAAISAPTNKTGNLP